MQRAAVAGGQRGAAGGVKQDEPPAGSRDAGKLAQAGRGVGQVHQEAGGEDRADG